MNRRTAVRLAAALASMPLGVGSILTYQRHYLTSMLMLAACLALLGLGVRLDPRRRAAKTTEVCEIPHPTVEEEDVCERMRLAAKGDRP